MLAGCLRVYPPAAGLLQNAKQQNRSTAQSQSNNQIISEREVGLRETGREQEEKEGKELRIEVFETGICINLNIWPI